MDENPYRSPLETGYRPPPKPAPSFNYVNFSVAALLAVIVLTVAGFAYAYVVSYMGIRW